MTLRDLRDYRVLCAAITSLEKKLERDKIHVVDAVQTAADFPYWLHTVPIEGDLYPYPVEPERAKIRNLREKKARIERFISSVEDFKVRRALEVCFLEPCDGRLSWESVAEAISYEGTGDALRMKVKRYLEK